jgi:hypothetical protein
MRFRFPGGYRSHPRTRNSLRTLQNRGLFAVLTYVPNKPIAGKNFAGHPIEIRGVVNVEYEHECQWSPGIG